MILQVLAVLVLSFAGVLSIVAMRDLHNNTSIITLIFVCGFIEIAILGLLWGVYQRECKKIDLANRVTKKKSDY